MNTNLKSGSHLYRRGWLGLIPLIGVFVGLVLLILAIFKYKDKKLMVIGIACILFTFLIYSLMDYRFESSKRGKKEKAQFVINDLNRLVIEVEFYKLQNKSYPDSLEQLYKNDKNVFIYDILSVYMLHRKLHKFNYNKTGDKYSLFSSGIDEIPNTEDDIYPTISLKDSAKTVSTNH